MRVASSLRLSCMASDHNFLVFSIGTVVLTVYKCIICVRCNLTPLNCPPRITTCAMNATMVGIRFKILLAVLNGRTFTAARDHAGAIVGTAFTSGLKFWTLINGLIFAFVPLEFRVLWGNLAAVGWGAYISMLASNAAKALK